VSSNNNYEQPLPHHENTDNLNLNNTYAITLGDKVWRNIANALRAEDTIAHFLSNLLFSGIILDVDKLLF